MSEKAKTAYKPTKTKTKYIDPAKKNTNWRPSISAWDNFLYIGAWLLLIACGLMVVSFMSSQSLSYNAKLSIPEMSYSMDLSPFEGATEIMNMSFQKPLSFRGKLSISESFALLFLIPCGFFAFIFLIGLRWLMQIVALLHRIEKLLVSAYGGPNEQAAPPAQHVAPVVEGAGGADGAGGQDQRAGVD